MHYLKEIRIKSTCNHVAALWDTTAEALRWHPEMWLAHALESAPGTTRKCKQADHLCHGAAGSA